MGATKKSAPKRKTAKSTIKKQTFNCNEVERYLDRAFDKVQKQMLTITETAVSQVKREIIPQIEIIDKRDKEQYDAAKKIMIDANELVAARQRNVELDVSKMREDFNTVINNQETIVNTLHEKLDLIKRKLDEHVTNYDGLIKQVQSTTERVNEIKETLDNVSANGNKGLSASFADMYTKLSEMQTVTEGVRARAKFWRGLSEMIETTPLLKPFKTKWGAILYLFVILVVINTIVHSFGIDFDISSILKGILMVFKGGG